MKKIIALISMGILVLSSISGCSISASSEDDHSNLVKDFADKVIINAYVYTADRKGTVAEAVAIDEGKFVFIGTSEEADSFIGETTEVIDLQGKLLMPSFFDGHGHGSEASDFILACDLYEAFSLEDYLKAIEDYLIANPDVKVVKGNGWSNTIFDVKGPRKEDLDAICKKLGRDIPIALWDAGHHSLWVNTKALEIGNITKDTPVSEGSVIEIDDVSGEPSGTLRENIADVVVNALPSYSVEEYAAGIMLYQEIAHSYGVTGSFDAYLPVGSNAIAAYNELASSGDLQMYIRGGYVAQPEISFETQLKSFIAAREKDDVGELFQMSNIKFFEDGVVEGGTAYFLEPYAPELGKEIGFKSSPIWSLENLKLAFTEAEKAHFQIHVHSVGDAATRETIDAFDYAEKENGKGDYRNAITHLQVVDEKDIHRMKQLDLIAVLNPYWAVKDDYYYNLQLPYLGQERAEKEYPVQSFLDEKVMIVTASDFPITNPPDPLQAIELGITRTIPEALLPYYAEDLEDPKYMEPLWKEEAAGLSDLIYSTTYNPAYAYFLENTTGSIEIGKSADMVILSQNLFDISVTEISNTIVLSTFFQGEEVYTNDSELH